MPSLASNVADKTTRRVTDEYDKLPLAFVPNRGQTDKRVRFYAQGPGHAFYFTSDKAVLSLSEKHRGVALQLTPLGASPKARLEARGRGTGRVNYLVGSERHTNLPTYRQLTYRGLWPGIDMVFRGAGGRLKYEFRLKPGVDPSDIRLAYRGADALSLGSRGNLLIQTPLGRIRDSRPRSYQRSGGNRVHVGSRYDLRSESAYGFALGSSYDPRRPLVIDPDLAYSTFLGGASAEQDSRIAVDAGGSAYVTGLTESSDFPTTPGAFDSSNVQDDPNAFVTKLNATGSGLVYSTYLGGSGFDRGSGIALDGSGNAYVTGETSSSDFPTTGGAFDTSLDGFEDAFVTKLNDVGTALVYSSYLGGAGEFDQGHGIAVDAGGSAFVTGATDGDFPATVGAFDETFNGAIDVFAAKLDATGSTLDYSTYLGGDSFDNGSGIAVDAAGNAYLTGLAGSRFPTTPHAFDTKLDGDGDAFVTKVNTAGSRLVYSTFLGGAGGDGGVGVAADTGGSAYVTGSTDSTDFPTTAGAFDTTLNNGLVSGGDGFAARLNVEGSGLVYSTYLGGSRSDTGSSISLGGAGSAYLTGTTNSSDFPTSAGAFDTTANGDDDAYVTGLDAAGSSLIYSTYLGGSGFDDGFGIDVDGSGNVYVAGETTSSNFPTTTGAFDTSLGGADAFITKIVPPAAPTADLAVVKTDSPDPVPAGEPLTYTLTVSNSGPSDASGVTITDQLPKGVRFRSAQTTQGRCVRRDGRVTCSLGELASGAFATVTIAVRAGPSGTVTNSATVSAIQPEDPNGENNTATEDTTVLP